MTEPTLTYTNYHDGFYTYTAISTMLVDGEWVVRCYLKPTRWSMRMWGCAPHFGTRTIDRWNSASRYWRAGRGYERRQEKFRALYGESWR